MEFDNLCVAFGLGSSNDMSNAPCGLSAGAACALPHASCFDFDATIPREAGD
jgi:hypothetical protein